MSITFTKLFSSITESTVWCEPDATRLVWITMLAMSDRKGRVWASVPGLASRARVDIDACRKALQCFLAPDPDSRTKEYEGRRIEEIDGGWRLLNHAKYVAIRDEEDRKGYQREWVKGKRRHKESTVDRRRPPSTHADADADAEVLPPARAPKGGGGKTHESEIETPEARKARIQDYIYRFKQYRDAPSTLAMLAKVDVEEVKVELAAFVTAQGNSALFSDLAKRVKR